MWALQEVSSTVCFVMIRVAWCNFLRRPVYTLTGRLKSVRAIVSAAFGMGIPMEIPMGMGMGTVVNAYESVYYNFHTSESVKVLNCLDSIGLHNKQRKYASNEKTLSVGGYMYGRCRSSVGKTLGMVILYEFPQVFPWL